jgi:hypothetical protein
MAYDSLFHVAMLVLRGLDLHQQAALLVMFVVDCFSDLLSCRVAAASHRTSSSLLSLSQLLSWMRRFKAASCSVQVVAFKCMGLQEQRSAVCIA